MKLLKWEDLPKCMKRPEVRPYYDYLQKKKKSLYIKRGFDFYVSALLLVLLSPVFLGIGAMIKLDSKGPVMFRQVRVTQNGRKFQIYKFRTMVENAESIGSQVTTNGDMRVTRVGKLLRGCRLDELPQLINVFMGDMSFVGTRPEVVRYVKEYSDEMWATLLLPAGITSKASIMYKDENELLTNASDADRCYVEEVLPAKMAYNLESLMKFNVIDDFKTMLKTVLAVLR